MGFGPAAAIGAKIGAPDRKVVCLVGDGGFLSVVGALTTAVELGVPVLWVLFNNFCFSTIRTVGVTYFKNSYGTEFTKPDGTPYNPDFPLLAKAFGIESALVEGSRKTSRNPEDSVRIYGAVCPRRLELEEMSRCLEPDIGTLQTSYVQPTIKGARVFHLGRAVPRCVCCVGVGHCLGVREN